MIERRELAIATFAAWAVVVAGLAPGAQAAQCGNGPGGFEAWKRAFSAEAQAKGIGGAGIAAR